MSLNQTAKKTQAVNLFTGKSTQNGVKCQKGTGGIEKITKQAETPPPQLLAVNNGGYVHCNWLHNIA